MSGGECVRGTLFKLYVCLSCRIESDSFCINHSLAVAGHEMYIRNLGSGLLRRHCQFARLYIPFSPLMLHILLDRQCPWIKTDDIPNSTSAGSMPTNHDIRWPRCCRIGASVGGEASRSKAAERPRRAEREGWDRSRLVSIGGDSRGSLLAA